MARKVRKAKAKSAAKRKISKPKAKKVRRKARSAKQRASRPAKALPKKIAVGKVSHFYNHISVAVVDLTKELRKGDKISIEGAVTNLKQTADSMQIEHQPIEVAKAGQCIGLKVNGRVRETDIVYKIV